MIHTVPHWGVVILVEALKETLRTVPFVPASGDGGLELANRRRLSNLRAYALELLVPIRDLSHAYLTGLVVGPYSETYLKDINMDADLSWTFPCH
jgi:hypothetical protein